LQQALKNVPNQELNFGKFSKKKFGGLINFLLLQPPIKAQQKRR
jgi:hypothetical protein